MEVCPNCGKGLSPEWIKADEKAIPSDLPTQGGTPANTTFTDVNPVPKTNWDKTDNSFPSTVSRVASDDYQRGYDEQLQRFAMVWTQEQIELLGPAVVCDWLDDEAEALNELERKGQFGGSDEWQRGTWDALKELIDKWRKIHESWLQQGGGTPDWGPRETSRRHAGDPVDERQLEQQIHKDGQDYGYGSGERSAQQMLEGASPEQAEEIWNRYMSGDMDDIYENNLEESPLSGEWAGGPNIEQIIDGYAGPELLQEIPEVDYPEYIDHYARIWMEGFSSGQMEGFEAAIAAQAGKMDEAGSSFFPAEWAN